MSNARKKTRPEQNPGILIAGIRFYPALLMVTSLILVFFTFYFVKIRKSNIEPVHFLSNHSFKTNVPAANRTGTIPVIILKHLREYDNRPDYTGYAPTPEDRNTINDYVNILPNQIRRALDHRLIGIYFINDFLGSGLTDWVIDEKGDFYCYMVMNPISLKQGLSEFITRKERTCFQSTSDDINIVIDCGSEYRGFLYILLHESAHLIDYAYTITPYVEDAVLPFLGEIQDSTPFTKKIWKNYDIPFNDFTLRDKISFYGFNNGPKIPLESAARAYSALANTPFPSLYACMNWAEDLAETVTFYHINSVLKKPYRILLYEKGKIKSIWEPMTKDLIKTRTGTIDFLYL